MNLGYSIAGTVTSGQAAIDLAGSAQPDLVLMAVSLPGPMDGVTAAQQIRQRFHLPVILLAAAAIADSLPCATETEPFGYLLHPFEDRELRTNIEMALYKNKAELEISCLTQQTLDAERQCHEAEAARKEGEKHLKTVLQNSLDGFYVVDTHGKLLQVNDAYCAMSGYTREELLQMHLNDLEQAETGRDIAVHMQRIVYRGGDRFESRHRRKDRQTLNIESSVDFQNSDGGRFLCFLRDITGSKRAEEALRTSDQHFRALFENMLEGFAYCKMLYDHQGRPIDFVYLEVNSAFNTLTGLTDVTGKKVTEVIPGIKESDPLVLEIYSEVVLTGKPQRFERDLLALGIWVSIAVYRPIPGHFVAIFDNVTERKRSENELQRNEDRLAQAVGLAALGIFERDHNRDALHCSPRLRKIFGWTPDEIITVAELMARVLPQDREILATGIRSALDPSGEGLSRSEYRILRPNGVQPDSIRWVGVRVQSFFEGAGALRHPVRTVGAVQDITADKQVELELSESRQQLRAAMEAAKLGFWSQDLITGEIFGDARTQSIFGNAAGKIITFEKLLTLVVPEDRKLFQRVTQRNPQQERDDPNFEYRINLPDGSIRWVQTRRGLIRDDSGRSIRTVGTVMDITGQKQAEHEMHALEQQFRQAQKMEAVGRLAGGVAHDFNNLLMVIQSYTEMMQDGLAANDSLRRNTEQVLKASSRAASLTRQLLAFSRKQVLSPVVLDLNAVVEEAAEMLKRLIGEDVDLQVKSAEPLWAVKADSDQIIQVLMNLAVNARDAMPTGGTLTVATSNIPMNEHHFDRFPFIPPRDYVMLSVTDTGSGISKHVQEQMFEPFFTTKELGKGTGLGLSTVFGIVKQSDGYVLVDSELGEGACFSICLPRMEDALAAPALEKVEQAQRGTETLLVVEDEEALRELICDYLRSLGYTLLAAEAGQQALSIVSQQKQAIDVLITDVVLPGMGGRELSQTLDALLPGLKTIYMSGYTDDEVLRHGVREEGVAFLQKPFGLATLASKVRDLLGVA